MCGWHMYRAQKTTCMNHAFLPSYESWDKTQPGKLGGKCLDPLSISLSPSCPFSFSLLFHILSTHMYLDPTLQSFLHAPFPVPSNPRFYIKADLTAVLKFPLRRRQLIKPAWPPSPGSCLLNTQHWINWDFCQSQGNGVHRMAKECTTMSGNTCQAPQAREAGFLQDDTLQAAGTPACHWLGGFLPKRKSS